MFRIQRFWAFRRCYSVMTLTKLNMNLEKCYFKYLDTEDRIDITFLYDIQKKIRQFNFSRKTTENVGILEDRICSSVQKTINKKNKKNVNNANVNIQVKFYDNEYKNIPTETTCLELFSFPNPLLKIADKTYKIIFNAPWVMSVSLPQSILAGFPVYPQNFIAHFTEINKSTFIWYKGEYLNEKGNEIMDIKWEKCGTCVTYTPTSQDIGKKLKLECIPGNEETTGPVVETISKNPVEAGPGLCPFETRHLFTTSKLSDKSFRCISYNILADLYCDSEYTRTVLHPYCPPYALHIDYRKQLIIKELLGYNADIICLQEVDNKVFKSCLQPILSNDGLEGLFYKKGKEVAEGLACFYRSNRFRVIRDERIIVKDVLQTEHYLRPIWDSVKEDDLLKDRILDRSTVASATILESIDDPRNILLVGNTHLYFHPDADHIRYIQGGIFIYWLNELRKTLHAEDPNKTISFIICGDFNSVPSSRLYQFFTRGTAPPTPEDLTSNASAADEDLTLNHNSPLKSACGTPPYTNFTPGFADCLDYIFYEPDRLEVEQVVPFPSVEELQQYTGLPSIVFPSDHIAVVADLKFMK